MSPAARSTMNRLDEARQRWWMFSMFSRMVMAVAISLAALLLCIVSDVLLQLSQGWLLLLFCLWTVVTLTLLARTLHRSVKHQRTLMAAARRVEQAFPELGSHLINLVQLIESPAGDQQHFREAAIQDAAAHVAQVPIYEAPRRHTRWQRWTLGLQTTRDLLEATGVLAAVILLAIVLNGMFPTWSSSIHRLFSPWHFVPQVGAVRIQDVTPGDATVLVGARLDIVARVTAPASLQPQGTLEVWEGDAKKPTSRAMMSDTRGRQFRVTVPAVMGKLRYRLQIGDSQSKIYHVDVDRKPTVTEVDVTYRYPDYLAMPSRTVTQTDGDLEAPQFTTAKLKIHCSSALSKGTVRIDDRELPGRIATDRHTLSVEFILAKSTSYAIRLVNEHGHGDADPRINSIHVIEDSPPVVQLVKPPRDTTLVPGTALPVVVRATDDYGLAQVWLEWKEPDESGGSEVPQVAHRWDRNVGGTATTVHHTLTKLFQDKPAGTAVLVRAVAEDGRKVDDGSSELGPQRGVSVWRRIELIDRESELTEELAQIESWQKELWAILKLQMQARVLSGQLARQDVPAAAHKTAEHIRDDQIQVQKRTAELANSIDASGSPEETALKQALVNLAHGDMQQAAGQAERVTRFSVVDQLQQPLEDLTGTQDAIIESLRRLLEFTRRATAEAMDKMAKRPGGDLPDDVQNKLRELRDKLEEFIKQQKRVIEATKNLAKKPVEDFTEEDKELLKQLAATEDDWARFLEEIHSDFSKLPEQDFANPSLLEELIEVQTEIKMAEGALTKKTADIAVPLEQLGAEMAEEMTTNLEKWLPDTPDRERWSQEESLTDAMKEAPMAELPGELEDLVGELMEEEEDLMDEMEDVSSSAADSLDKGAGWDAADGPISNMSARGVTGNRLPNTSEIGGRSGEGRQGKASGEFVGDTAVGKGGRKTPSRLAPDPFLKGEVKDVSKDPVGGATGGGKESGEGGEGLEGPVPQQVHNDMKRLAKKQAELRNRAEAVDLKFKVLNYHHEDLEKMIQTMAAVERELRSGRYRSALRRRQVLLDGLGHVKSYVEGEFEVRRDQSSNLPADIQKEILSSMQDASPAGWDELNRRYFQRLATENPGSEPAPSGDSAPPKK